MKRKIQDCLAYRLFLLLPLFSFGGCVEIKAPVDYVNPYMGNISHLLVPTYPTVHLPNSMLRIYPQREDYTSNKLKGLPVIVTSHRGNSAFSINPFNSFCDSLEKGSRSSFILYNYDNEKIKPYYYSVFLSDYDIEVKYVPSHQSALYQLDFRAGQPGLLIGATNGELHVEKNKVFGYQQIGSYETRVYLYLETDVVPLQTEEGNTVVMKFPENDKRINLRYGISFISVDQAKKNMEREVAGKDLETLTRTGRTIWNDALGKIQVKGNCEDSKTIFYTSLYRTYERMVCLSEDGQYYSAFDNQVHQDSGVPFYTDDWIWDTYRATHPLRILLEPEREKYMIQSFIRMAGQMKHFWMPTFPEITGDSRRMNSNHGVATVLDAYVKGITDFDLKEAYRACRNAITEKTLAPWSDMEAGKLDSFYVSNGYFPALASGEEEVVSEVHSFEKRQAVAVTLGTVYDEWCLAQIARLLDNKEDYNYFLQRSLNYHQLFNAETKFFHPKDSEGNFITPFDYRYSGGMGGRDYYGENNGWVYRWDVPHNVADLIKLMGGKEAFVDELEKMFDTPLGKSKYEFFSRFPDHTGNVGQFSMANEPCLHIPYLYNYANKPWMTQKKIRALLEEWFRNDLMGMPGDEDGGGMSAFIVFSQLGFYPVTPRLPIYVIGSPVFERAKIQLSDDKTFEVYCHNYSPKHKYIQSVKLDGVEWDKSWFSHEELMKGNKLEVTMGAYPNKEWASQDQSVPPSFEMRK